MLEFFPFALILCDIQAKIKKRNRRRLHRACWCLLESTQGVDLDYTLQLYFYFNAIFTSTFLSGIFSSFHLFALERMQHV